MPSLRLLLLGPPRVELNGVVISFDTRKALALLSYLALADHPQRRDMLADLLWPDFVQGRAALRRTLSAITTRLGEGWIDSVHDSLALHRSTNLFVDVDHFQAWAASDPMVTPRTPDALRAAATLYRDDFLAGFGLRDSPAFDDWQLTQAEYLRRVLGRVLESLVEYDSVSGDGTTAMISARRWLNLDPLNEQAHRALMLLHAQAGERSAAMHQYRDCVRVLERELAVAPLAETTELYRAIMAEQTPIAPLRPLFVPVLQPSPALPPLVGRDAEWAALLRAAHTAEHHGQLVMIAGPAGIGKTRLAVEALTVLRNEGAVTLIARCHQGEAGLAYAPFVALMQAAQLLPEALERLNTVPAWLRGAAAHLLPDLADHATPLPPIGDDARTRLFEGVTAALYAMASGTRATVIVLDDLQWADQASLELFAYIARRLDRRRLCLIAAWRADELPAGHLLPALLAELRRTQTVVHLPLAPLNQAEVATLAADLGPSVAERLFGETEGLPLLVVEYLALLRTSDTSPATWSLPRGARDLLEARLRRAGEAATQLLAAAAVIGRTFDAPTLRAVSGRSEDEVITGLEELLRLGLVSEGEHYDFSHGKLRELAYAATSLARRRLLHRRAAEAIASRAGGRDDPGTTASLVAQQYLLAGERHLAAAAFAQAGDAARRVAASATALDHYQQALALDHPAPGVIHHVLGDLHTLEGRYDDALINYEAAAAHAEPTAIPMIEARIAEVHRRRGAWDLARYHLQTGIDALDAADATGLRARLTADQSLTAHQAGDHDLARTLAGTALELAEHSSDQLALAQAYNLLGLLAREAGDMTAATTALTRSVRLAEQFAEPGVWAAALHNLALAHGDQGEYECALALAHQALDLTETQGDRHHAAAIHNTLADLLHAAKRDTEAMIHLKEAVTRLAAISAQTDQTHPGIWQLTTW